MAGAQEGMSSTRMTILRQLFLFNFSMSSNILGHYTIVLSLLVHFQNEASRIKLFKIDFLLIVIVAFVSSQLRTKFVTCYSPSVHDVLSHIFKACHLHCSFGSG